MTTKTFAQIFTEDTLAKLFPAERSDQFFDALYGDAKEGAYDISLAYIGDGDNSIDFQLELKQRKNKCLACNLTYGLPSVFGRHPLINLNGLVEEVNKLLEGKVQCTGWKLGRTKEISRELHVVPLSIETR